MKRIYTSVGLCSLLLLGACSEEGATKKEKEETMVENQKEEKQGGAKETSATLTEETESEEEIVWKTEPMTLSKNQNTLYENETGKMEFTGYKVDEEGKVVVVIGYSGEMMKANHAPKYFKIIMDNGNTFELGKMQLKEIRLVDDKEYHIYRSDSSQLLADIIRVDLSLGEYSMDTFNEEENTVIKTKITPTTEPFELAGTQAFKVIDDKPIERENSEMTIRIGGVQAEYTEEGLLIYGDITFKHDEEKAPVFAYMQPEMGIYETKELSMETNTDVYYEGTTVSFSENVLLDYPFAKDSIHTIYFTIGSEVFAVDLNTGKELTDIPATLLITQEDEIERAVTLNGHLDAEGKRFYDTYMNEGYFGHHSTTDNGTSVDLVNVGGYDQLTFKVGAKEGAALPHTYDLRIYAEDFDMTTDIGTVFYESEIKYNSPMTEHTIDVSKYEKIYILVDSKTVNEEAEEKLFTYLFADAVLSR